MRVVEAALAALLGLCVAGSAEARVRSSGSGQTYGYVYGEFTHFDAPGLTMDGVGGGAGWHFTRYLGIQGGGEYFRKTPLDMTTGNVELMLTYPANDKFSLYAGLGGSYLHASANPGFGSITRQSTGYRASLGFEYWFWEHVGLRAGYHRQNAGGVADEMGVGFAYRF